jgi:exonuclease III
MSITVLSLNIEKNRHYDRVLPFLLQNDFDVICLQEVMEDDWKSLQQKTSSYGVYVTSSVYIGDHYKDLYGKKQGVAIFSKHTISNQRSLFYWGDETMFDAPVHDQDQDIQKYYAHPLLVADITLPDESIYTIATTHFPVTHEGAPSYEQTRIMPTFLKTLQELPSCILCGDFNAPRGGLIFSQIASVYRDVVPQEYMTSIDQELHRKKGIQFMVDGMFLTDDYVAKGVHFKNGISDHMALIGTIAHRGQE